MFSLITFLRLLIISHATFRVRQNHRFLLDPRQSHRQSSRHAASRLMEVSGYGLKYLLTNVGTPTQRDMVHLGRNIVPCRLRRTVRNQPPPVRAPGFSLSFSLFPLGRVGLIIRAGIIII